MANHGKWIVSVEIDMADVLSMYRISTLRQRLVKSNFSYGFSFINYDVILIYIFNSITDWYIMCTIGDVITIGS